MYCMKCKKTVETKNPPMAVTTKNGRAAMQAECADCGTKMFKFVKSPTT